MLKRLILALCFALLVNGVAKGTIALVSGTATGAICSNTCSTLTTATGVTTTGATLLVLGAHYYYSANSTKISVSNSAGCPNSWQKLTTYGVNGSNGYAQIWYCYGPTTGTADKYTISESGGVVDYFSINVVAFSGTATTSSVFQSGSDAGATSSSGATIQPGSVTPNATGDLVITLVSSGDSAAPSVSVNDSFTSQSYQDNGKDMDGGLAYLVDGNTNGINPTWTISGDTHLAASIAIFVASSGNSYTRNLSESNTASDAISRLASFGRGDSETNTASDAIARLASFGRGDNESNTASDALARKVSFGRGDSESSTASDAIARVAGFGRGDSESNTTSDAVARLAGFGRNDSESNTASDSLARVAAFGRSNSESNTASDAVASLETVPGSYSAALYETNTASDVIAIAQVLNRSASENNIASDALARLASFGRGETENIIVHGVVVNWNPSTSTATVPGWERRVQRVFGHIPNRHRYDSAQLFSCGCGLHVFFNLHLHGPHLQRGLRDLLLRRRGSVGPGRKLSLGAIQCSVRNDSRRGVGRPGTPGELGPGGERDQHRFGCDRAAGGLWPW